MEDGYSQEEATGEDHVHPEQHYNTWQEVVTCLPATSVERISPWTSQTLTNIFMMWLLTHKQTEFMQS